MIYLGVGRVEVSKALIGVTSCSNMKSITKPAFILNSINEEKIIGFGIGSFNYCIAHDLLFYSVTNDNKLLI